MNNDCSFSPISAEEPLNEIKEGMENFTKMTSGEAGV